MDSITGLVLDLCGIYLDASKGYLIETRLGELAKREGCASYRDLVERIRRSPDIRLGQELVDAITTQETLFFRDGSPFEALKHKVLPDIIDAKSAADCPRKLRIWSAACSTGQEPYSIAMTLCDLLPDLRAWDVQILATDICNTAIAQASRGRYSPHEMDRGLSSSVRSRYFVEDDGGWTICDSVRSLVSFRQLNLHDPFVSLGKFDIVMCRNVAIYFTAESRANLFDRMRGVLHPEGYLFVGSAESLSDLGEDFVPQHHCRGVFYQPNRESPLPNYADRGCR